MKSIKNIYERTKAFCIKYPVFLSGLIICCYLFFRLMQFIFEMKSSALFQSQLLANIVDSFDAFLFMLLLSVALINIIEIRTKLHKSEAQKNLLEHKKELDEVQLKIVKEVTRRVKHHINNPLAVISISIGPARKAAGDNQKVIHQLDIIDEAGKRITTTLEEFSNIRQKYIESSDSIIVDIAKSKLK